MSIILLIFEGVSIKVSHYSEETRFTSGDGKDANVVNNRFKIRTFTRTPACWCSETLIEISRIDPFSLLSYR